MRGWVGFDLDGTLAEYHGWQGMKHIGAPVPKMVELVKRYLNAGITVKVITARASQSQTFKDAWAFNEAWADWSMHEFGRVLEVTSEKDMYMLLMYDDRCVTVEKNTGELLAKNQYPVQGIE